MAQDINWFPGHMRRTLNETKDALKLVDLVYETCDARFPFSSRNPDMSLKNYRRTVCFPNHILKQAL